LVLLLHVMASYTEGLLRTLSKESEHTNIAGTSVGVVVRKYWSRLSQLQTVVKQAVQEKNAMSREVGDLENEVRRLDMELKQSYSSNRPKTGGLGGLIPPNRAEMISGLSIDPSKLKEFGLLGRDEYNKASQTNETAFTPCDACSIVQKSFRQSGETVVSICQQQQIPSCLQKFRPQVSHLDWLPSNDVSRWAAEQNKDLQRISKLTATIKPIKDELNECREKSEKLEKRVQNFDRDLKREKDDRSALQNGYEKKIKEIEMQHTKTLELEVQQRELLERHKQELERMLSQQKHELLEKQSLLRDMENIKSNLEQELTGSKVNHVEVQRLQREMTCLQGKLEEVACKMAESAKDLQKEQAKNKSVSKHTQSLQSKQESLMIRIEVLDEENKELKDKLAEMEDEKDTVDEKFEEFKRQITQKENTLKEKQSEIDHLLADKESLEQSIHTLEVTVSTLSDRLEEAKERERLIVEYPDINGPVNPDLSGTGDILLDMENQVKANNIRIQLLERQNDGLRNSISKLSGMQQQQQYMGDAGYGEHAAGNNGTGGSGQKWAVQRSNPKQLWDTSLAQRQRQHDNSDGGGDDDNYNHPEYSNMENMYNNSKDSEKPLHVPSGIHGNQGVWNQAYVKSNKTKVQSGVQNMEFDSGAIKHHTSPLKKDRPPFGHRPLTTESGKKSVSEFVVGRPISRPESTKMGQGQSSSSGVKSRPSSGKTYMTPVNATSIGAYLQMKKAGKLNLPEKNTGMPTPPAKLRVPSAPSEDEYVKQDNFSCHNCDKMYTKQRDLEIHMSYCTG
ncbi:hypothetical protein DPMN_000553, partial [Dreissena polymorpha]